MNLKAKLSLVTRSSKDYQAKICELISQMTLKEKIGQMSQFASYDDRLSEELQTALREGKVGSVLNEVNLKLVNEIQRIAVEESRLGIP